MDRTNVSIHENQNFNNNNVLNENNSKTSCNIYTINPNFSDYIVLEISDAPHPCYFLLDTEAHVSILKISALSDQNRINNFDSINICGVTRDVISSLGSLDTIILVNNFNISHKFQIVNDEFPIHLDGILGKDFIRKYECNLNYKSMNFSFDYKNKTINIPIQDCNQDNLITIPRRCQVIRKCSLNNNADFQFIDSREICSGVFIARSIVDPINPFIRILNTTDEIVE